MKLVCRRDLIEVLELRLLRVPLPHPDGRFVIGIDLPVAVGIPVIAGKHERVSRGGARGLTIQRGPEVQDLPILFECS